MLGESLGPDAERVELTGAELKADPEVGAALSEAELVVGGADRISRDRDAGETPTWQAARATQRRRWLDPAGRRRDWADWAEWLGRRAAAGELPPKGFPKRFR